MKEKLFHENKEIIILLQKNSRMTTNEISKETGVRTGDTE